jgi:hypothetical protein
MCEGGRRFHAFETAEPKLGPQVTESQSAGESRTPCHANRVDALDARLPRHH